MITYSRVKYLILLQEFFFKYDLYTYFSSREYDRHKIYCITIKFCWGNEMEIQIQGER